MKLRTRLFLAAFGIAAVSLFVAASLISWSLQREFIQRIEDELVAQTRLVGELASRQDPFPKLDALDAEADALGHELGARVTLVAPGGKVVGDSAEDGSGLLAMENYGNRPG